MNDPEQQLRVANGRFAAATQALAREFQRGGAEWKEYWAAHEEVLSLERQLAATRGEEYAETIPFPVKWDCGTPLPHLLRNDHRTLLAFLLSEPDPNWDGTTVKLTSAAAPTPEPLGMVEFDYCVAAKLGAPNDEVIEGHPLHGRGLEAYRAQRVINSRWIKEVEAINSVHRLYRPERWHELQHFIFWFHDSTFECLARSYKVETHRLSVRELLHLMVERLIS